MRRKRPLAQIDPQRCTGCGRCIAACPLPIIAFETHAWRKYAVMLHAPRCTGCSICEPACPVGAITLVERTEN